MDQCFHFGTVTGCGIIELRHFRIHFFFQAFCTGYILTAQELKDIFSRQILIGSKCKGQGSYCVDTNIKAFMGTVEILVAPIGVRTLYISRTIIDLSFSKGQRLLIQYSHFNFSVIGNKSGEHIVRVGIHCKVPIRQFRIKFHRKSSPSMGIFQFLCLLQAHGLFHIGQVPFLAGIIFAQQFITQRDLLSDLLIIVCKFFCMA